MLNDRQLGLVPPQLYEIFVAGIPASTSLGTLRTYFQSFGPVESIEFLKSGKKGATVRNPKKVCKLATMSREMFLRLTGPIPPQFRGRVLFCQQYKSGPTLLAHSADVNSRRVVVKKVAPSVNLDELRKALQRAVGPIEVFYQYKFDVAGQLHSSRDHKTYSVTFVDNSAALRSLLACGSLELPTGVRVEVEQFCYNRKREKTVPNDSNIGPLFLQGIKSSKVKTKTTAETKVSPHKGQKPSNPRDTLCRCAAGHAEQPRGNISVEIGNHGYLCHTAKPTAASYHRREPPLQHASAACALHPSNIRLNLARPRLSAMSLSETYF